MPPNGMKMANSKENKKGKVNFSSSQVDYTQPLILKNSKAQFGEKLEQVKEQHKDTLEDLIMEMSEVKKENERLRRQQQDTSGISMDTVERMKKELERARTTRMFLLEDVEIRKAKSEKMEAEIFELNMKLESFQKKINHYNKMRDEWEETRETLVRTEEKCDRLTKINKNLRMLLVKHHIDPKTVEFDSGKSKRSARSDKASDAPLKAHSVRPILKPPAIQKKPDAHSLSHGIGRPKITRSAENIHEAIKVEDMRKRNSVATMKALGRGPPSYLGYYTTIHQNKLLGKSKSDAVHLPRLAVA